MEDLKYLRIPQAAQSATHAVIDHTDSFCERHLDTEYTQLCRKLAAKLGRKRPTPLTRGSPTVWAAAIIYAIGSINFLFDRTQQPHLTTEQLSNLTGVPKSTMANKAKAVRDLLRLTPLDFELCRQELLADLPGAWLIQVDGLIMDARTLPREVQDKAHRQGLIPDPSLARKRGPG